MMRIFLPWRVFLVCMALLVAPGAAAAQALGPEALVKQVTQDVLDAIKSDAELAAGDKRKALRLAEEKILPHVDFEEATRLAVGRNWAQASPEQRARLVGEFRAMLVRTYSNAIGAYQGQTMRVMPVRMRPGETDVTVRNQFVRSGGQPLVVEFGMHHKNGVWKIYDIVVEGVSLVLTYRSEFDVVVRQDGIDGLIRRLQQKNTAS